MKVKVFAKLNLTLNVKDKIGEFHSIDSVATSVDIYDVVEVTKRRDKAVNVYGMPQVPTELNTAYKAAKAFVETFDTFGVEVNIDKHIPFGAGLGGSSADAAAVVYCMCRLFQVDANSSAVHELCARIGSDVNFMLHGGLGRLRGKGDDVSFYTLACPLYFALTTFGDEMSSGEVYAEFDKLSDKPEHADNHELLRLLQCGENAAALKHLGNCLQSAAQSRYPYADNYLNIVKSISPHFNMTGSGSAYYVACTIETEAKLAAQALNFQLLTTTVCKSVPSGIIEL